MVCIPKAFAAFYVLNRVINEKCFSGIKFIFMSKPIHNIQYRVFAIQFQRNKMLYQNIASKVSSFLSGDIFHEMLSDEYGWYCSKKKFDISILTSSEKLQAFFPKVNNIAFQAFLFLLLKDQCRCDD